MLQRISVYVFQDILDQTVNLLLAMVSIRHHQLFALAKVLVFPKTLASVLLATLEFGVKQELVMGWNHHHLMSALEKEHVLEKTLVLALRDIVEQIVKYHLVIL